jgi:hypothetical protein
VAFALLQAHNIIPHQHGEHAHADQHHDAGHSHHHQPDEDAPFDFFNHDASFGKVLAKPSIVKADFFTFLVDDFVPTSTTTPIRVCESKSLRRSFGKPKYLLPSSYSYAVPLRAPPSLSYHI